MAKQLDCAYIAAFLDTDGWITIRPANHGTTHSVTVGLVNRHLKVLEWVQSLFGGNLLPRSAVRKSPHAKNWSQTYDLHFRVDEIAVLLNAVKPYLKIKKEQAEIVLAFLETTQDRSEEYRLNQDVKIQRRAMYKRVRELNWVGIDRSGLESI